MSTVIITKLEPFYQLFLKNHFKSNRLNFEFPRDHDLNTLLSFCKKPTPPGRKTDDFGDETFEIEFPLQPYDEKVNYYLPEKALILFQQRVIDLYQLEFHSDMCKLHSDGYLKNDAIIMLIYKYGLPDDEKTIERMKKDFYRWRQRKYNKKRSKKKQKKSTAEAA
ncbi:hypothetical protein DF185_19845 [Marinifilum breve]|uniref:Uncharacterized protein n=1 Tax=Marinifilum breve TaxID=2184082 RepID=A0A2V3ZSS5_9BACT|nr:hypothetical protein [Marinifilum breve]PXX96895.1 hypothetical protein DF185_19845 [Marinifilum breve]